MLHLREPKVCPTQSPRVGSRNRNGSTHIDQLEVVLLEGLQKELLHRRESARFVLVQENLVDVGLVDILADPVPAETRGRHT